MKICIFCGNTILNEHWYCDFCKKSPSKNKDGILLFVKQLFGEDNYFKKEFFDTLSTIEEKYFWFASRRSLAVAMIKKYFQKAEILLEIGIGTGTLLQTIEAVFPKIRTCGADIHLKSLVCASKKLKRTTLFQMDVMNIPFENEFDLICAFDLIEHIEEDQLALNAMYKAICDNGGILITVPQYQFLWSHFDDISCHKRRYARCELISKIQKAGFKIIRVTSFVTILFPLLCFTRLLNKRRMANSFIDYFKVNNFLNVSLKSAMKIDNILLGLGINLPIGGSLLVIAKKEKF